jgi:hypothetical protein
MLSPTAQGASLRDFGTKSDQGRSGQQACLTAAKPILCDDIGTTRSSVRKALVAHPSRPPFVAASFFADIAPFHSGEFHGTVG